MGQGGYSDIYRVADGSGALYALKHLRLAGNPEHITEVQREAKTMARVRGGARLLRLCLQQRVAARRSVGAEVC